MYFEEKRFARSNCKEVMKLYQDEMTKISVRSQLSENFWVMVYTTDLCCCNNNNLWNIHFIIPCRRSFSVLVIISGISPYTNRGLIILPSKQFYW